MSLMGGVNAQLLYKISGNGLEKPSYIVGTYHLAPGNFADSIPGLKDAFASYGPRSAEVSRGTSVDAMDWRRLGASGRVFPIFFVAGKFIYFRSGWICACMFARRFLGLDPV
jgi:hypothetical protein